MNQSQFQKAAGISAGLAARWFQHIDAIATDSEIKLLVMVGNIAGVELSGSPSWTITWSAVMR